MDKFDRATRSRIMSAIRSTNTSPELKTFRELAKRKIYFQRHYKRALGSPDIAIPSKKKAVFIDGDFWHGFRYPLWKKRLTNKFWTNKIERNRRRDKLYHARLRRAGWEVLRVWEHQLAQDFRGTINILAVFLSKDRTIARGK